MVRRIAQIPDATARQRDFAALNLIYRVDEDDNVEVWYWTDEHHRGQARCVIFQLP